MYIPMRADQLFSSGTDFINFVEPMDCDSTLHHMWSGDKII